MNTISKLFHREEPGYLHNPRICFRQIGINPKFKLSDLLGLLEYGKPRPDLTLEKVELVERHQPAWEWEPELYTYEPIFTNIDPIKSVFSGWFRNVLEYQDFAWLEFARRNPKNYFAKKFRKAYRINKQQVEDFISGKKFFHVIKTRGITIVYMDRS